MAAPKQKEKEKLEPDPEPRDSATEPEPEPEQPEPEPTPEPEQPRRRRGRPRGSTDTRPRAAGARAKSLKDPLEASFDLIGRMWAIRDPYCGGVWRQQAPDIARELDAWGKRNPGVRQLLEFIAGGEFAGLGLAVYPVALAVQGHHIAPAIEKRRQLVEEAQAAAVPEWSGNGQGDEYLDGPWNESPPPVGGTRFRAPAARYPGGMIVEPEPDPFA